MLVYDTDLKRKTVPRGGKLACVHLLFFSKVPELYIFFKLSFVVCVLSAEQRATESHAARHSVHTPQPEIRAATTLQNLERCIFTD